MCFASCNDKLLELSFSCWTENIFLLLLNLPLLEDSLVSLAALSPLGIWIVRVWLMSGNSCPACLEQLGPSLALFPGLSQEITLTVHGGLSLKGSTATLILLLPSCQQWSTKQEQKQSSLWKQVSEVGWRVLATPQSEPFNPPESHCPQERAPAASRVADAELVYFAFFGALRTFLQTTLLRILFKITSKWQ